ncbi:MAG: 16S rRNA (adenine(1518)-N(6)/adenine(1519)-N(6))-dimethyltransferase RsmA [Candidatus Bathyarchaeia archaeon]|nr:ribosomal RNA small subunit methyltransferase A [Candidatus Bathyarchaeota archaeon]
MEFSYGLIPKKKLGQHFILNKEVLLKLIEYAKVNSKDVVLEVGAGLGNLTELIAAKAKKVIAVEKDSRFTKILKEKFKESNVEVIEGDILKIGLNLPYFNKILGNIPYYISSKFILLMLKQKFDLGVLTLQKEFAERLNAQPGMKKYGRITIAVKRRVNVEVLDVIPKTMFTPKPKVDSSIVRFTPKEYIRRVDEELFEDLTRSLFNQKRRKTSKVLLRFLIDKYSEKGKNLFNMLTVPDKRVYELSIEELEDLTNQITFLQSNTTVLKCV